MLYKKKISILLFFIVNVPIIYATSHVISDEKIISDKSFEKTYKNLKNNLTAAEYILGEIDFFKKTNPGCICDKRRNAFQYGVNIFDEICKKLDSLSNMTVLNYNKLRAIKKKIIKKMCLYENAVCLDAPYNNEPCEWCAQTVCKINYDSIIRTMWQKAS